MRVSFDDTGSPNAARALAQEAEDVAPVNEAQRAAPFDSDSRFDANSLEHSTSLCARGAAQAGWV